ncbi:multiheme c-type cytochrome [Venenivibrio stagnispumantis]|uniref:Cytochrome c554 and c-prime n=1 Tax=Venenivibrio stagnispumantis TaxID=407998 RepID=A0AA46ACN1_9AQUI|nr:cytochrome c family protein [Venenivibrio stagnispumantis]MCW4572776.1 cytochrome c family protein [Venenivibrio stagnispumantis]SMP00334.1 Cytochrome c554 and c-prime [Venenivibrio stagnispumantis]
MQFRRFIFLILASSLLSSCDKIGNIFQEKDLLQRPVAKRCSDCHTEIYNQWKESRHAVSWISEHYKKASGNYTEVCISCHVPYEITAYEKPKSRDFHREDGINCASCHFKDSTKSMHGPYDVFSPPHPSTKDELYTKADICSGCHQETFKQWKTASVERSCQECHMPAKEGKLIQKFPFNLMHASKPVHDHSFKVPTPKKDFFDIQITKQDKNLNLVVINKKIPHNIPTGDNGNPKYYIDVSFLKDKQIVYTDSAMITKKENEAIPYNQPREISFYSPADFDEVKITFSRKLSWQDKPEKIFDIKKSF